jgi:hypothetical protein
MVGYGSNIPTLQDKSKTENLDGALKLVRAQPNHPRLLPTSICHRDGMLHCTTWSIKMLILDSKESAGSAEKPSRRAQSR